MTEKLIAGFARFRASEYEGQDPLMPKLVKEGQSPEYFVISCIDSRSNTGTIFNAPPGLFFSFMAMGAIVRPYKHGTALSAALQFALKYCGIKKIIVLGHTQCGAIRALADNIDDPEIVSFITVAREGLKRAQTNVEPHANYEELLREAEKQIVLQSVENLKEFPSVQEALAESRVEIKPWVFDMKHGQLLEYSEEKQKFVPLATDAPHVHSGSCGCSH